MKSKRITWFLGLLTALILVFFVIPTFAVEEKIPDGAVATVNGIVITQDFFEKEMARVSNQFARSGRPLNESQSGDIKKRVLETLINRELLYQESQHKGIKIEDTKVNGQLDTVKKRFPSDDEYQAALTKMKITEAELKSQIREGMAIQQFVDNYLAQDIAVSDAETIDFYEKNPEMFKQPEQIKASHILVKVDTEADEATKGQANKKIKEIQKKLETGQDFASLAAEFSEGPSNVNGGDLGYFSRGQMVKPFEDAAFKLKSGEVSDIVETRFGYHLIKVVDKKPESVISYDTVKDKITQYIEQGKKGNAVKADIEKLRQKADIKRFMAL